MAELYGIARCCTLSPGDIAGLHCMGRECALGSESRPAQQVRPWARIGLLRHHPNDPATLMHTPHSPMYWAWLGEPVADEAPKAVTWFDRALDSVDGRSFSGLNWPFLLCRTDDLTRTLWLISDPFGLHPLYYACHDGLLVFSTKLFPLLRSGLVRRQLDYQAVVDFFTWEHVTGCRTLAEGVHILPPATILCFRGGHVLLNRYDEPLSFAPKRRSLRESAESLHAELVESVRRAAGRGRSVAIPLSGGLDSRALLGCALELGLNVKAFTFGRPASRDVTCASHLARACGVPHTVVEADGGFLPRWMDHGLHVTGGMVNCIHWHILTLADVLSAQADVVLDGLGGDAWTGGHLKWSMVLARSVERATEAVWRMRATAFRTADLYDCLFEPDVLAGIAYDPREAIRQHMRSSDGEPIWFGCHRFDILQRQRRFVQYGPHLLRPMIDVRTPFYAHGLTRRMAETPVSHLIEQRAYLRMHQAGHRRLAEVPDAARGLPLSWPLGLRFGGKVIDAIRRRAPRIRRAAGASESVTDYAGWFRDDLREWVTHRLLEHPSSMAGLIQRTAIERLLAEHFAGQADHAVRIGCLLTFQAFMRAAFVSAASPDPDNVMALQPAEETSAS